MAREFTVASPCSASREKRSWSALGYVGPLRHTAQDRFWRASRLYVNPPDKALVFGNENLTVLNHEVMENHHRS